MIPAIPSGDVHDLFPRFLVTVVAPIDMNARRVEMSSPEPVTFGVAIHGVTLASLRESAEFPTQVKGVLAMFAIPDTGCLEAPS